MPLTPALFYADLAAARVSGVFPMAGINFDRMALGLSAGVAAWAVNQPQNLALQGTASGSLGSGSITSGKLVVAPNPPVVIAALASAGMVGPLSVSLGTIVGLAIAKTFTQGGLYTGVSPSVGVGADVSKVIVSNASTLIPVLLGTLGSYLGPGPGMPLMAMGLGNGIAQMLMLGAGTGSVVGSSGPSPATGITTSVVV